MPGTFLFLLSSNGSPVYFSLGDLKSGIKAKENIHNDESQLK